MVSLSADSILINPSKTREQLTTKMLHHLPSAVTLVLKSLAVLLMLQPTPAATWATSTFPSAKAKATTHRRVRMLAMLKRCMIARTQQLMVATSHAYVISDLWMHFVRVLTFSQVFFNAYVLSENAVPQGLYCSMYNETWGPSYGTNYGQYRGSDRYTVSESYSYTLSS